MPPPRALQLALRRVNERIQKVLSRSIHRIFNLPGISGVWETSDVEREGPSLRLKAPLIYTRYNNS